MTNLWKTWSENAFEDFEQPANKKSNTRRLQHYQHYYNPKINPFDLYDLFDKYSYSLTWNNDVGELEMDIPGVKKEDISVVFERDYLSIDSNRKGVKSNRKVLVETAALDHDKCEAKLEDGVLYLKLVKKGPLKKILAIK